MHTSTRFSFSRAADGESATAPRRAEALCELLRYARERYPHIVRILTTAYSEIEHTVAAVNEGQIHRYIKKPWDITSLRMELIKWRQDLKCGGTPYEIRATMDEARSSQTEMQQRQQQKEFAQQWIDLRYPLGKELKPSASLSGSRL